MTSTPRLFAPTVDKVSIVIGEQSHQSSQEVVIECTKDDSGHWTPQEEFKAEEGLCYQFEVVSKSWFQSGEQVRIVDPRATELSADGQWSVISDEQAFTWQHDDCMMSPSAERIIYEIYVHNFLVAEQSDNGTFASLTEHLSYLTDLGINAIELMPIKRGPAMSGWGYTPLHFFSIEPRFGTADDFCALVDAAHSKSIAVILDGVYNHAHQDHPLAQIDHDYWFHHEPRDADLSWGPQFNYNMHDDAYQVDPAKSFAFDHLGFWIQRYHIDGIRFDAAGQIQDPRVLGEMRDFCHQAAGSKPFGCIAEYFPETPSLVGPSGVMDRCWRETFSQTMLSFLTGANNADCLESLFDCRQAGYLSGRDVVNYLSSHDTGHTLPRLLAAGLDEDTAIHRMTVGYTILLCAVGVPMLYMGDEFAAANAGNDAEPALNWQLLEEDTRRQHLHDIVRGLIHMRRSCDLFHTDNCKLIHKDDAKQLIIFHRWNEAGGRAYIVINCHDSVQNISIQVDQDQEWHEFIQDFNLVSKDGVISSSIDPWCAQVYVNAQEAAHS